MTDKTMGQRISERRKLLGLSQEGLGEKLEVSRQAVSKWESDAAVPDVDKLIALSKLFSVNVGWLLGVEDETSADNNTEIHEAQMKTIEELIRRYTSKPEKKHSIWVSILCGAALGLGIFSFVLSISNLIQGNQLFPDYDAQLNRLSRENASIESQLADMNEQLLQLVEGEKLYTEYSVALSAWKNYQGATVSFFFTAKTQAEGDKAYVSVRYEGKEIVCQQCHTDGMGYSVAIDLPSADGYSYYFQIRHADGTQEQNLILAENVGEDTNPVYLQTVLAPIAGADVDSWGFSSPQNRFTVTPFVYADGPSILANGETCPTWQRLELVLKVNGQELDRRSILREAQMWMDDNVILVPEVAGTSQYIHSLWLNGALDEIEYQLPTMSEGAKVELWVEAELSNGLTAQSCPGNWIYKNGFLEEFI